MTISNPAPLLTLPSDLTIRTSRLFLEPLQKRHASDLYPLLADPAIYTYTGGSPPDSIESLASNYEYLESRRSPDGSELWLNWVVRAPAEAVGYLQATVGADHADIAWVVGVPWQGRGYASEAARGLVTWLLKLSVKRIRACVHPNHAASQGVARSAGLRRTEEIEGGEEVWILESRKRDQP